MKNKMAPIINIIKKIIYPPITAAGSSSNKAINANIVPNTKIKVAIKKLNHNKNFTTGLSVQYP